MRTIITLPGHLEIASSAPEAVIIHYSYGNRFVEIATNHANLGWFASFYLLS